MTDLKTPFPSPSKTKGHLAGHKAAKEADEVSNQLKSIITLGRKMRSAQTEYFSTKSKESLARAKMLEASFDKLIQQIETNQPTLFNT